MSQYIGRVNWKGLLLDVHEKEFHDAVKLYNLNTNSSETKIAIDRYREIVDQINNIMPVKIDASEALPLNFELKRN